MKKVIAILLVLAMVFAFAACKKDDGGKEEETGVPFDAEVLEANWQDGSLTFENGNTITLPCTVSEILEASGLTLQNADTLTEKELKKGETINLYLFEGTETRISIDAKNTGSDPVLVMDAKVTRYSFKHGGKEYPGNKLLKFAGTLTVDASRIEIEDVLGEGSEGNRGLVTYEGTNSDNRKVQMKLMYDLDGKFVNNVAFEVM